MKKKFLKKIRGEITSSQLVSFILVLVGFIILLFVFYQFGFSGLVDSEACHSSVILRATASQIVTSAVQGYVPLKCQIKKLCVTSKLFGSGTCDSFIGTKGVTKAKVSDVEDVNRLISQEVVECWKMMGEGKVDLFTQTKANFGLGNVYPTCVICSRIAFDKESLAKNNIDLSKVDPKVYMETHKVPDQEVSYTEYLSGSPGKFKIDTDSLTAPAKITIPKDDNKEEVFINAEVENSVSEEATTEELAVLFMQISAPPASKVLKNLGLGAAGFGTLAILNAPKATWNIGRLCFTGVGSIVCGGIAILLGGTVASNIYSNRELSAGKCEDVLAGQEGRNGCSVVRVIPYNMTNIAKYCSVIEGIA